MAGAVDRATGTSERVHEAWIAHHERLWRSLLAWSGDADVASDAAAEAFAQALRRGDAIDDVGAWVWRASFRIAGGLLQDRRRDDGSRGSPVEQVAGSPVPEEVAALADALDRLPAPDRLVVVLSLVGGWPAGEVARLTDSTAGAVRVRLHRARTKLRHLLEDDDA